MDTELAIRLIHELAKLGAEKLIFSGGGEIFLHPDIYTLILKATLYPKMKLTLMTNLLACSDPDFLIQRRVSSILVNFHATNRKSYAAFHPGTPEKKFDELLEKIDHLRKGGLAIKLVSAVNAINFEELPKMLELASHLDCNIQFKLASVAPGTEVTMLTKEQKKWLWKQIPSLRKQAKLLGVHKTNLEVLGQQLQGGKEHNFPIREIGCYAGYYYSRIQTDATVHYCCKSIPVGNCASSSFMEIWQGERYESIRRSLEKGKFFPVCDSCGKYDLNYTVYKTIQHFFSPTQDGHSPEKTSTAGPTL